MVNLKQIVARVLNIKESKVTPMLSRGTTEEWDSFNHLLLISEIEKKFGIKFTISEVERVKTFKELQKLVEKK